MNELDPDRPRATPNLKAAVRSARAEDAQRVEVIGDLRAIALARLSLLRDALEPVLAQIPKEVELFDVGLMPGDPPRLFIDMIAFVETARDRRSYRFFQDRRDGRLLLAERDTVDGMAESVTRYIAQRLVERDRALASQSDGQVQQTPPASARQQEENLKARPMLRWVGQSFWFVVEVAGLLALLGVLILGLRWGFHWPK